MKITVLAIACLWTFNLLSQTAGSPDNTFVTGLYANKEIFDIDRLPNTGKFSIELPETEEEIIISITDITGRLIYNQSLYLSDGSGCKISLVDFSGFAMVRINIGEETFIKNIVVM